LFSNSVLAHYPLTASDADLRGFIRRYFPGKSFPSSAAQSKWEFCVPDQQRLQVRSDSSRTDQLIDAIKKMWGCSSTAQARTATDCFIKLENRKCYEWEWKDGVAPGDNYIFVPNTGKECLQLGSSAAFAANRDVCTTESAARSACIQPFAPLNLSEYKFGSSEFFYTWAPGHFPNGTNYYYPAPSWIYLPYAVDSSSGETWLDSDSSFESPVWSKSADPFLLSSKQSDPTKRLFPVTEGLCAALNPLLDEVIRNCQQPCKVVSLDFPQISPPDACNFPKLPPLQWQGFTGAPACRFLKIPPNYTRLGCSHDGAWSGALGSGRNVLDADRLSGDFFGAAAAPSVPPVNATGKVAPLLRWGCDFTVALRVNSRLGLAVSAPELRRLFDFASGKVRALRLRLRSRHGPSRTSLLFPPPPAARTHTNTRSPWNVR
jgi:hypothetical protein